MPVFLFFVIIKQSQCDLTLCRKKDDDLGQKSESVLLFKSYLLKAKYVNFNIVDNFFSGIGIGGTFIGIRGTHCWYSWYGTIGIGGTFIGIGGTKTCLFR
ncbi:unnamed protein product [marine sediment metagenome]|uniref:Uncharacterized protein n=1 Tax=marine sediment metagenome TaxID=412755 RepID=X1V7C6_9ZZZZ